jgi:hypothetical protein
MKKATSAATTISAARPVSAATFRACRSFRLGISRIWISRPTGKSTTTRECHRRRRIRLQARSPTFHLDSRWSVSYHRQPLKACRHGIRKNLGMGCPWKKRRHARRRTIPAGRRIEQPDHSDHCERVVLEHAAVHRPVAQWRPSPHNRAATTRRRACRTSPAPEPVLGPSANRPLAPGPLRWREGVLAVAGG